MADSHRHDHPVIKALHEQPTHYEFYAALRQLECYFRDKPRLGESVRSSDDPVRLEQEPSNLFAPSSLFSCSTQADGYMRLRVLFFGLFGPNGAMPNHFTEYVQERRRVEVRDEATLAFFNLFHHRLLSLFYRAWAEKEPTVQRDRPETDHFNQYVGSLLGLGIEELQNRDVMPDDNKRYFSAYLGDSRHHVSGLVSIVETFLKIPCRIQEFVGEWLCIPEEARSRLGKSSGGHLGIDTVLGSHSWQCQYRFRLIVGPMDLDDYESLLPRQAKFDLLKALVRNYLGDELNWDVQLILKKEQVPTSQLKHYGLLGWNTWLKATTRLENAKELILGRHR
ncbi:type VI secretion system baseplate subunit TssG [Thiolinea disciformis]|uniref:type VI secretion system baseplate subunit TssG n=1 Tax=Thiolinea disciformis TaxID=125614 RepID=UPI0003822C04|nr:type VI secretion system baseplate subunit TssG [Thiolinea disciformis]